MTEASEPSGDINPPESTGADQSREVEAGAKKSPSLLDAPATYILLFVNILWFAAMLRSGPAIRDWHLHQYGSILTDPFSDLKLYYKSPLYLMKGELIDPGLDKHVKHA